MTINIRNAKKSDEKEIIKLLNEYDKYEHKLDKRHKIDSIKELKSFFNLLIKNKNVIALILEKENKVIGFISGEESKNLMGKGCKIHQFIITKNYRKKGYGKKLLRGFENTAKKRGCKNIQTFVFIKNKNVLRFYNKLKYSSEEEGFMIRKKLK